MQLPPMFPRSSGTGFMTDRPPSSSDLSRMIVDGLRQVGFDTALFSGSSASLRRQARRPLHGDRGGGAGRKGVGP